MTANDFARDLFDPLGPTYERAGAVLSLGLEAGWRRRLVDELAPRDGGRYLDVATGTGLVAREIRRRARCEVIGVDLSSGMLAANDVRSRVVLSRAEELPFPRASFDGLTFTYLLRYVEDPAATLRELARVVRPGGRIASLELHVPRWQPFRAGWFLYFRLILPILGAVVSRTWIGVARFLPGSIERFYEQTALADVERLWQSAGIRDVRSRVLGLGAAVVTTGTRGEAVWSVPARTAPEQRKLGPAFYALAGGAWRDFWTLLHPPYTAWHLSYVLLGAALAPELHLDRLAGTLVAFGLALGIGVHALDELNGRPLRTGIPDRALLALGVVGIGLAVALGVVAAFVIDQSVLAFVAIGLALALAYPLELARGRLHGDLWFAIGWGAFPVLTAYWANALAFGPAAIAGASYAVALSYAQRRLSTWVRTVRRRTARVDGMMVVDGSSQTLDPTRLIAASESALRWLSLASVLIAIAVLLARVYH